MSEENLETDKSFIDKIKNYIKENKFLSIAIIFLVILIVVLVIVYVFLNQSNGINNNTTQPTTTASVTTTTQATTSTTSDSVDVLPQTQRSDETIANETNDYDGRDPFSSPAVLKGTVINDKNGNMAIIEVNGSTYVVAKGDTLADIWTVKTIKSGEVTLLKGNAETVIKITAATSADQVTN